MNGRATNVAILGSTGSIGRSTLQVIEALADDFRVFGLTAHSRCHDLLRQAQQTEPRWVVATSREAASEVPWSELPASSQLLYGEEGVVQLVQDPECTIVVSAIVGSAGLRGTWAAVEAGKRVALANKETLVVAGPQIMRLKQERGAELIPVDSEHSAIFQALAAGRRSQVRRILLTASGGPFLRWSTTEMAAATIDDALAHPTWDMGRKITIDSATMMNKALEIIEARWLFDLDPDQIQVVVHPQSVVHSFVEFIDGSVLAQLSPPDMKLPIQYALTYPERRMGAAETMDWQQAWRLEFEPPDEDRFPSLALGHEVARAGGTAGAVVNAANEAAVQSFLDGHLKLTEIVPACRAALEAHNYDPNPTLAELLRLDAWAREEVLRWKCL